MVKPLLPLPTVTCMMASRPSTLSPPPLRPDLCGSSQIGHLQAACPTPVCPSGHSREPLAPQQLPGDSKHLSLTGKTPQNVVPCGAAQRPFKVSKGASLWSLVPGMMCAQSVVQERSQRMLRGMLRDSATGHSVSWCVWRRVTDLHPAKAAPGRSLAEQGRAVRKDQGVGEGRNTSGPEHRKDAGLGRQDVSSTVHLLVAHACWWERKWSRAAPEILHIRATHALTLGARAQVIPQTLRQKHGKRAEMTPQPTTGPGQEATGRPGGGTTQ